jgi:integrase
MPKPATGELRWKNGTAIARITLRGRDRVSLALPACTTEDEARTRSTLLAQIAQRLRASPVDAGRTLKALELVAAASAKHLRIALSVVEELVDSKLDVEAAPTVPTVRQLGEQWTTGELARRYPDQIRAKRSADDDESRLRLYVYPVIGDQPIDRVTLDACEGVMRRLPERLAVATRRNVGQLITRIVAMAVYPLRYIERSPIPPGFLPSAPKQKALAHLYPSEDARLMACVRVPLAYRLLWGFLTREGMREGEALELTWADLDLERGAVRLDKNKTDDPRAWALDPGVADALRRYRASFRPDAQAEELVFLDPRGRPFTSSGALGLPALLRGHLVEIGLHRERPELFTSTAERRRIRVHDLRGTFVTIALANGRSESWISDRTGHRSSVMIARYKRTARTFAELQTGELEPLFRALPELSLGDIRGGERPRMPTATSNSALLLASPAGFETDQHPQGPQATGQFAGSPAIEPLAVALGKHAWATDEGNQPASDPVEAALAEALRRASDASQWSAVEVLSRELTARREARSGVVDLEAERKRRGGS